MPSNMQHFYVPSWNVTSYILPGHGKDGHEKFQSEISLSKIPPILKVELSHLW